jgi:hypothetical protein
LYITFRFHFIPVLNVDGYEYTKHDRLWKKNRQPNFNRKCIGTDINRNFPYEWGNEGASSNPCSPDYNGVSALSTPCASNLYLYIKSLKHVGVYFDIHSFGQRWMYPSGQNCSAQFLVKDIDGLINLILKFLKKVPKSPSSY